MRRAVFSLTLLAAAAPWLVSVGCSGGSGSAPSSDRDGSVANDTGAGDGGDEPDARMRDVRLPPLPEEVPNCAELDARAAIGAWRTLTVDPSVAPLVIGARFANSRRAWWSGREVVFVVWDEKTRSMFAYEPVADTWRTIPVANGAPVWRENMLLGFVGTRFYVYGGVDAAAGGSSFDVETGNWSVLPTSGAPLLAPNGGEKIFELPDGRLAFFGGTNGASGAVATLKLDGGVWTTTTLGGLVSTAYECDQMAQSGEYFLCRGTLVTHGVTYADGGLTRRGLPPFSSALSSAGLVAMIDTRGVVVSRSLGADRSNVFDIDMASPSSSWTTTSGGLLERSNPVTAIIGGRLVVWGGFGGGLQRSDGYTFDPSSRTVTPIQCAGSPPARAFAGASKGTDLYVLTSTATTGSFAALTL